MENKNRVLKAFDNLIGLIKEQNDFLDSCPDGLELDELECKKNEALCDTLENGLGIIDKIIDGNGFDQAAWDNLMIQANKHKDEIEKLRKEQG